MLLTRCVFKTQMPPIMANSIDGQNRKTNILKQVEKPCRKKCSSVIFILQKLWLMPLKTIGQLSRSRSLNIWTRGLWAISLTWETVPIDNTFAQSNYYALTFREKTIISFLRIEWLTIHKILSPNTKIHCAKFSNNWSSGSEEDDFWISSKYFAISL